MIANHNGKFGLFIAAALLAACAAKPPNVQEIPASADASAELQSTQSMLDEARSNSLDILAPKNFERAQARLDDARRNLVKGKSKEKVLENLADSRAWLAEAEARGEITRAAAKNLADARSGAIRAKAPSLYPKEFEKIDKETRELSAEAEKGDLDKVTKEGDKVTQAYHKLEIDAVTKMSLGDAQINIEAAKKDGAAKTSPKTLAVAETKLAQAMSLIKENPRNTGAISRASAEATEQSRFLLAVNQKTKAGNTEDLVLQTEKQKRVISGLTTDYAETEATLAQKEAALTQTENVLAQKEAALKAAAELRNRLEPNEAEVFVENNAVKVRLKGVQFGSNQATINKKSAALLDKVDKVLGTVGASAILIEGHTDSVGSPEINQTISEKRAQAVQNYLVQKGQISSSKVRATGLGEENPISDNATPRGRSENRRIDLLIEPKVE
jgi:outer membrane protein OmpA-like peptidoglycan-associated protein